MNQLIVFVAQYVIFFLPVLLIIIFLRLSKDIRPSFLITLVIGGVLSLIGILIASHLFYSPRPFMISGVAPLFSHAADNGFPSDHMTLSAALAFIGYAYSRKIGLIMTALALAIGVARVLAHVHSWVDIFGGIIVALLSVILAFYISHYITNKWLPRLHTLITK